MRTTSSKLAAVGAVAALAFAGAACESGDTGPTSPGQEAPESDITGGDTGTDTGMTDDTGLGDTGETAP